QLPARHRLEPDAGRRHHSVGPRPCTKRARPGTGPDGAVQWQCRGRHVVRFRRIDRTGRLVGSEPRAAADRDAGGAGADGAGLAAEANGIKGSWQLAAAAADQPAGDSVFTRPWNGKVPPASSTRSNARASSRLAVT